MRAGGATGDPMAAAANAVAPMRYNGITIAGYAQDVETIEEFKHNLETGGHFVVDGKPAVYFDERYTDPKPFTDLDNAGQGALQGSAGSLSDGASRDKRGERGGRLGRLAASNAGSTASSAAATQWGSYNTVISFRIDVQYTGAISITPSKSSKTVKRERSRAGVRNRDD